MFRKALPKQKQPEVQEEPEEVAEEEFEEAPQPKAEEQKQITREEIKDMLLGHLQRAGELAQYLN